MAILSREKTKDCWLKMNLENTYCFSHLHPGSSGIFCFPFSPGTFLELQKTYTDPLRSPGKPSVGVLWCLLTTWLLCMPIYWSTLIAGHIWLQMFPFLLRDKESPLHPENFY